MKLIRALLNIVSTLFILLFSLFFILIFQDNKGINNSEKKIAKTEFIEKDNQTNTDIEKKQDDEIVLKTNKNDENIDNNEGTKNIKFYYMNLDENSKLIYNALEEQKDKLKNGTSEITISSELGKAVENGENIETIFSAAVNAFEHDNPDLFYIEFHHLLLYCEKNYLGYYKIYIKPNETSNNYFKSDFKNEEDVNDAQIKINSVVQQVLEEAKMMSNDYEKILYVHDWIIENTEYDETLAKTNNGTIYGVFIDKEAVCGGYAKAFKYLMDRLNIKTIIVQGTGTNEQGQENHAWNYVELYGNWYGIDCTWDDPIILGNSMYYDKKNFYTYFLKGQNTFDENHEPSDVFYSSDIKINYPELSRENY